MLSIEGWQKKELGELLGLIRNGYSGRQVGQITEFPVSRIETISNAVVDLDKVGYVDSVPESYLLKSGDILFSNINSVKHIGKVAQIKNGIRLYHGMNLLVFRPTNEVDENFLFYKLTSEKTWFEKMAAQAINQASINQTTIKGLVLCIPQQKPEQAKIAEILSTVDRAIEQTEGLIAKQQRIKTGLMQDLLTRGIDEHGNLRSEQTHQFKDSPLGRIPVEWEPATLGGVGTWSSGGTPSKNSPNFWGGSVPWVSPKDMKTFDLEDTIDKITDVGARLGSRLMPEGTVFIVIRGMILAHTFPVCYATRPMAFNQDVKAITARPEISSRYIAFWLTANEQTFLKIATTATHGTKRFDMDDLYAVDIAIPGESEQLLIVKSLDDIHGQIQLTKLYAKKLYALKTALMQDLLTGKKRVTTLLNEK